MEAREERGLIIAAKCKLTKRGKLWSVPSQSNAGKHYMVCPDHGTCYCSCPDHELTGKPCKHVFAVRYVMQREENDNGETVVTETVTITETKKPTYPQDWVAYNAAQTNEKAKFQSLLADLCSRIKDERPASPKGGRPRLSLADAIFACCFKVYSTVSGRRFMTDLREANERGFIGSTPHFNSIFNYLEDAAMTPILKELLTETSLPLRAVEQDFAIDSSGFSTNKFDRWFDEKYGTPKRAHRWVKVHLVCGLKTNVVVAVELTDKHSADPTELPGLVKDTRKNFNIREMSGDKAYASVDNLEAVAAAGGMPFMAFKSNHTGAAGGLWAKMFHYFSFRREEFLSHYRRFPQALID